MTKETTQTQRARWQFEDAPEVQSTYMDHLAQIEELHALDLHCLFDLVVIVATAATVGGIMGALVVVFSVK